METRRFLLALVLSLVVFLLYVRFFAPQPPQQPPAPEPARETAQKRAEPVQVKPEAAALKFAPAPKGKDITVETDLIKAVISTSGGVIKSWELKKYKEADKEEVGLSALWEKLSGKKRGEEKPKKELGNVQLLPLYEGVDTREVIRPLTLMPLEKGLSSVSYGEYRANRDAIILGLDRQSETLVLTYAGPAGIFVEKRLTFHNNDYKVDVAIATRRLDGYTLSLGTDFGIAEKLSKAASGRVGLVAFLDGKNISDKLDGIKGEVQYSGTIHWFGHGDKYFTATVLYGDQGIIFTRRTTAPKEVGDLLTTELLVKENPAARTYGLYAGPKSYTILKSYGRGMEQMVDYGWFGILAKPMFLLMQLFYGVFKNYGIAIIFLTIVVRILLFYPSLKSAMAMEEMKAIQPQLMAVREKYKKDPARMNQEMMKLYKEHKVNPLGGCLPMLLQLPFFIALYNVLNASIELRQASFIPFWIKDLSVHDPYYILPVLMGLSMILTMKMTSTTTDPTQAKIMMFMNIAFIFLFAWLPAGLLLYITLSNVLSIVQQLYVKKIISSSAK